MINLDFTDISWPTDKQYRVAAYAQLCNDFPFISALSLKRLFETYRCHYFPTKKAVDLALTTDDIAAALANIGLELALISSSSSSTQVVYQSPLLQTELQQTIVEAVNPVECQCCYGEYAFETLVQCSEGCLFCRGCLNQYTEETVFGEGRASLKCISASTATPCCGMFIDNVLRQALPEKVYLKLAETEARAAILAAELKLVQCYACAMQVEMEGDGDVMVCPIITCGVNTCCKCGKAAHSPNLCILPPEYEETRHTVEEAMTHARLRTCGKCKAAFIKVDGCNNITCACGAHICYICNKMIGSGYSHFNRPDSTCRLYTDSLSDDKQAMLAAGLSVNTDNIVNVNNLLETQTKANPNVVNPNVARAFAQQRQWVQEHWVQMALDMGVIRPRKPMTLEAKKKRADTIAAKKAAKKAALVAASEAI